MVTRVIDGDTIEIEGGQKVRYIGIDAPETVNPTKLAECFGQESTNSNKKLTEGKKVSLEKDISETDKYGRLLRYVFVDGVLVNEYMVRNGYANSSPYPPDVKYQQQLNGAEIEARENTRGLWGSCTANQAQYTREISGPDGCPIKGNISQSTGEKIYHAPGQKYYDKTTIDKSKGERWFCNEDEAKAAGWRKSKI